LKNVYRKESQAYKGLRWMPRHLEAKTDVISCDKPRGAAK